MGNGKDKGKKLAEIERTEYSISKYRRDVYIIATFLWYQIPYQRIFTSFISQIFVVVYMIKHIPRWTYDL